MMLNELNPVIRAKEAELEVLRAEAKQWSDSAGLRGANKRPRKNAKVVAKAATGNGRARYPNGKLKYKSPPPAEKAKRKTNIDWAKVLAKLPTSFTMDDLKKATPSLNPRPLVRNFTIARWSKDGEIKKVGKRQYKKL